MNETSNRRQKLLCTLGPTSLNSRVIGRLQEIGVSLFRINLSHTALDDIAGVIETIQRHSSVPICLDSEGAQVRTGHMEKSAVSLAEGAIIDIPFDNITGTENRLNLTPLDVARELQVGDVVSLDFNAALIRIVDVAEDRLTARVISSGKVGSNKAVSVDRSLLMPAISEKDRSAFQLGVQMGIENFALSFAHSGDDVDEVREIVGDRNVISKIECEDALKNFSSIAEKSNAVLIDRGDLSREVPLEYIPQAQKRIIDAARRHGREVYVATNLLETMVHSPLPTRAEVNDIYNTLLDGADGLVLAAETAIGQYPIQCAEFIVRMISAFETHTDIQVSDPEDLRLSISDPGLVLVEPHGGKLVDSFKPELAADPGVDHVVTVNPVDIVDCEQIAIGTYSPLQGFMGPDELTRVLDEYRLLDGNVWTLPITFQTHHAGITPDLVGGRLGLALDDGEIYAFIDVTHVWSPAIDTLATKWFGTDSSEHPGVQRLMASGDIFVGGEVTLVKRPASPYSAFEYTPAQTRRIFRQKGWNRVVGFHGRNPAHRVHEYIQKSAMASSRADGLFINPVIGPKKPGDFLASAILDTYQLLISEGVYDDNAVLLGAFPTYSRYSGPREAVFTALCRKNVGCSHFIVGRDHTGVGDFYAANANCDIFDTLGDIGIEPVFFGSIGYDPKTKGYGSVESEDSSHAISGTQVRMTLSKGERLPNWFIRDSVQDLLLSEIAAGRPVFHNES